MEPENIIGYYLVFTLSDKQFALPLHSVERVVLTTAVTPLPSAPEIGYQRFRLLEKISLIRYIKMISIKNESY